MLCHLVLCPARWTSPGTRTNHQSSKPVFCHPVSKMIRLTLQGSPTFRRHTTKSWTKCKEVNLNNCRGQLNVPLPPTMEVVMRSLFLPSMSKTSRCADTSDHQREEACCTLHLFGTKLIILRYCFILSKANAPSNASYMPVGCCFNLSLWKPCKCLQFRQTLSNEGSKMQGGVH